MYLVITGTIFVAVSKLIIKIIIVNLYSAIISVILARRRDKHNRNPTHSSKNRLRLSSGPTGPPRIIDNIIETIVFTIFK